MTTEPLWSNAYPPDDADPEVYNFEVRPPEPRDLRDFGPDRHLLDIISPTSGGWTSHTSFGFRKIELVDLRDRIDAYLESLPS